MTPTLTNKGLEKIGKRFIDSIDHAAYTLNGEPKTVPPLRSIAEGDSIKVYVYFDDTVVGTVANVQLVDKDGDVVAQSDRTFDKPQSKGLYVAFKYNIQEMEVTDEQV